ncbi:MAG: tyrosine-protein phosphatase [Bacilli bacterium]|nr:tyrosine-protein phosphatase [Bacilli bacterium]
MKILPFTNMLNVRDIGGFKTKDGHIIKDDVLIRSDAPKDMANEDFQYLVDHNILFEIDLRTEEVTKVYPSSLLLDGRFEYIRYSLDFGGQQSLRTIPVPQIYCFICEQFDTIKTILKDIIYAPSGVYLNCTAGKDRTGIIVCLILLALGVDEKEALRDYSISAPLIDSKILQYCETHPTFPTTLGTSRLEDIEEWYLLFKKKYGDINQYLSLIGLSSDDIKALKNKFLI